MKQVVSFALVAASLTGSAVAQTNSKIQETFFAGAQVSNNKTLEFQGDVDYPERFLTYTHEGDKLKERNQWVTVESIVDLTNETQMLGANLELLYKVSKEPTTFYIDNIELVEL